MITHQELKDLQSLTLSQKISMSEDRIKEWYKYYNGLVYVSFSGGKDSTVLLDLCRNIYNNIPAVFVNTGLEYPEVLKFVKLKSNISIIKPDMMFYDVIEKYGFPVASKIVSRQIREIQNPTSKNQKIRNLYLTGMTGDGRQSKYFKIAKKWMNLANSDIKCSEQCCNVMKKKPLKKYEKETKRKPFIGTLAQDSWARTAAYLKSGCNSFTGTQVRSAPLSFWTEDDILNYIKNNNLDYCQIYGDLIEKDGILKFTGEQRTGCMFCMFGVHLEKEPNRFQRMKCSHPKHYDYCINKLGLGKVLDFIGVKYD